MSKSSTTTHADLIEPIHPGKILMEDFIKGFDLTQNKFAVSIGVLPRRINEIVHRKLRIERCALRDKVAAITPLGVA